MPVYEYRGLSDFEKEMKKVPTLISEGNNTPPSNRSLYHNLFRSQISSNSLESLFLDNYIKKDVTSKAQETVMKNSMIVESIGFKKQSKNIIYRQQKIKNILRSWLK